MLFSTHRTSVAIQEGISEEAVGYPQRIAPAVHLACVLADVLEGLGVLTGPGGKGCPCITCYTGPTEDCRLVPTSRHLALTWSPSRYLLPD